MYLLASSFALGEQKEQCRQLLATAIAVAVLKLACLGRELQHRVDQLGPRQTSSTMYFSGASYHRHSKHIVLPAALRPAVLLT